MAEMETMKNGEGSHVFASKGYFLLKNKEPRLGNQLSGVPGRSGCLW